MMDENRIIPVNIESEMKKSYLEYAMSVIVSRALPDVRDGLKPVHRRILYAMHELNLASDKPHRKSARIVGDVLGKYHPHGDTAVYFAMVRLAQDFSSRYMMVDGHGNFGSVDGDSAAAMRYTEARMAKITAEMLRDIEKETVDYRLNFDETLKEPTVMPSRFPNLLVNGSNGIAVGMATSIPPHNLTEVINGCITLIDDPEATVDMLMEDIQGPDFPTGAIVNGMEPIREAYRTGRGKVRVRSKSEIEEMNNGKHRIVVTEIPYQVNKARLIEKIADLVRDKKIDGITDLRDESDREGMRMVIELRRDANANIVLNNLYKHTQMEDTFSIIMLALVNNEPKVLTLKQMLQHYLRHQQDIVVRRTKFDLRKANERAHILEGLRIAMDHIDEIVKLIRASNDRSEARERLMERFGLSEIQAKAIVDMRLGQLTGLERDKIETEFAELQEKIKYYKEILASEELIYEIVKEELIQIRDKYGDDRRTKLQPSANDILLADMIEEKEVVITLTHFGYIKRIAEDTYRTQRRGGKGLKALTTRDEDFVENILITSSHAELLFFTNTGRVYSKQAFYIPEATRTAKGTAVVNVLELDPGERVTNLLAVYQPDETAGLIFATKRGIVKKTPLTNFTNIRRNGLRAVNLRDDDELIDVKMTSGNSEVMLTTSKGKAIRFEEEQVREMGRTATGVKGIQLDQDDFLVSMNIVDDPEQTLLVLSEFGYGKRTELIQYKQQHRGGKGLITYKVTDKTGRLIGAKLVTDEDDLMVISQEGIVIRLSCEEVSVIGRSTQGVRIMHVNETDQVVSIAKVAFEEPEDEEELQDIIAEELTEAENSDNE